nr:DUF2971 domain-containing protein [uncultured Pseudomonas sp.]
MGLYKYVAPSTLLSILKGTIRFTQPGGFNDPFELLPQIFVPEELDDQDFAFSFDLLGARRRELTKCHGAEEKQISDGAARQVIAKLNESIGILCLSHNPDSLLMWGYYAADYSGAVIEFDQSHEFFSGLSEVVYLKKRPILHLRDMLSKPFPIANLFAKPIAWRHENEVRLCRSLSDCKNVKLDNGDPAMAGAYPVMVMDIPIEAIKRIVLGERCSIECQRKVWHLLKGTSVIIDYAYVSNWGYFFRYDRFKLEFPYPEIPPFITPLSAHVFSEEDSEFGEISRHLIASHPLSEFVNRRA